MSEIILNLPSEKATNQFGKNLSNLIEVGDIIYLSGEMGSGKTTIARSIIKNLLVNQYKDIEIPSPTFTLVQVYSCKDFNIGHADLYRIENPNEIDALGIEDILYNGAVLIEWPDKIKNKLNYNILEIKIKFLNNSRAVSIENVLGWGDRIRELAQQVIK
jgi:tRNA threonylcarbamoyl adenosine modification protein YjeE